MIIHNPILTGSFSVNGADLSTITGSVATSASFDARTTYLESTSSILTAASASQSVTSGSLVAASASLSATSGSLSAASGSFNTRVTALEATGSALSSSLLTVSGSGYATSGSLNTRVSALEVTGSALSSSLLTVSGSGYATSASLSAASGSFNSRVATIESKYATTGSNTFIDTQVVSGSILQSGSFTSTGTLTAQTLVIQTITSSVVYSSGSNVFGNNLGNSQVFTGSVLITGSLTIAGASSATSYSGVTIYGSTIACSPIGCFATSCATSFIGGTMSGTTIYGSTAVCSANGLLIGNGGVTATCNYLPKFTGTSTIGNSSLQDDGSNVFLSNGYYISTRTDNTSVLRTHLLMQRGSGAGTYADILTSGDTSNGVASMQFGFNSSAKMILTSSGNLGIGVIPFDNSLSVGLDIGIGAGLFGYNNRFILSANAYYNANWKYKATAAAAVIKSEVDSSIQFLNAPSGTAGCAITFTQAMTLDASGNLLVGTSTLGTSTAISDLLTLGKSGSSSIAVNFTDGTATRWGFIYANSAKIVYGSFADVVFESGASANERMRIFSGGNVLIQSGGTFTDNGYKLDVNGTFIARGAATFVSTIQSSGLTLLGPTGAGTGPSLTWDRSGGYGSFAATYKYENTYYTGGSTLEFQGGTLPVFRMVTNNAYTVGQVHFLNSNVGIGTCSPNELFEVKGTENQGIRLTSTATSGEGANLQWFSMQSGDNKITAEIESDGQSSGGNLFFKTRSTSGVLTDRVIIDNAGNVGIGTAAPGYRLETQKTTAQAPGIFVNQCSSDEATIRFKSTHSCMSDFRIGASILVGSAFEIYNVQCNRTNYMVNCLGFSKISNDGTFVNGNNTNYHSMNSSGDLTLYAYNTNATGNGILSNVQSCNTSYWSFRGFSDPYGDMAYIYSNGTFGSRTGTYGGLVSDARCKTEICDASSQWSDIKNLRVRNFKLIEDVENDPINAMRQIGFIAQEVETISPGLVFESGNGCVDSGCWKNVKTSIIHTKAVKALQEAMCRIEILESCLGIS